MKILPLLFLAGIAYGASPAPQQYITPNPIGGPAYGTPIPKPTAFKEKMAVITHLPKPDVIAGGNVMLVWNAAPGATGYKLLQGTASGKYSAPVDEGNVETVDITVAPGTYFWVVQAYNTSGESASSNEVTATISAIGSPSPTPSASSTPIGTATPTPTPKPTASGSPTPSQKFIIGASVKTTVLCNVRATAGGTVLGTQKAGATGTVTAGPVIASIPGGTFSWWNVTFSTGGVNGWIGEDSLVAGPMPTPTPKPTYNTWESRLTTFLATGPTPAQIESWVTMNVPVAD
jgi:hypothetical protein